VAADDDDAAAAAADDDDDAIFDDAIFDDAIFDGAVDGAVSVASTTTFCAGAGAAADAADVVAASS
jgi:hypothetical protein